MFVENLSEYSMGEAKIYHFFANTTSLDKKSQHISLIKNEE